MIHEPPSFVRFWLNRSNFRMGINVSILKSIPNGKWLAGQRLVLEPIEDTDPTPAICNIDDGSAQKLMDDLWNMGIRPTENRGGSETVAAMQRHLEDMRTIAFGSLRGIGAIPNPHSHKGDG